MNNITTFFGGIGAGVGMGYLVYLFCKSRYWIRDITEEEKEAQRNGRKVK